MIELHATLEETAEALAQAAEDILERMFFLAVDQIAPAPGAPGESTLIFEIFFRGDWSGRLSMALAEPFAREVAAGFTGGLDPGEVPGDQVEAVLCELTNMLCGATLSRLAPHSVFDLATPQLVAQLAPETSGHGAPSLARRITSGADSLDLFWSWNAPQGEPAP